MNIRTQYALEIERLFSTEPEPYGDDRFTWRNGRKEHEIIFGRDVMTSDPVLLFGRDKVIRDACRGEEIRALVIELDLPDDLPRILELIQEIKGRHDYAADQRD
jgi:hypothetical protein